jgi:uncharacterized ion transporter superfamily protein YfcC
MSDTVQPASRRNGAANTQDASTEESGDKRKRGFPAPVTILTFVLILVWIAAFFIPSGQYKLDAHGSPIAGSFTYVASPLDFGGRVQDLLLAPVNGMYGILDPDTGMVGPFNKGTMFGSVEVFLFILSIGGFMTVVFATGALNLGIHHLTYRFRKHAPLLIAILTLLFGVLGSIKGWSDETLGLYAIMVPLMVALGYDRLVTVAVVTVAPFVGAAASTINPFKTGIGSSKAGVSIADGMSLRLLLLVLTMAVTVAYTLWYAGRVKTYPAKSLCGISAEDAELAQADARVPQPLTATHAAVIGLVFFTFALLAFSIVPWGAILDSAAVDPYTEKTINSPLWWELGWWLPELSALFFVMAIVVGIVARLGEEATAKAFIKGVIEFAGPAFLVTLARSVSVVMTNTKTIDTVLHAMEGLVGGASSVVFVMLTFIGSLPLSFLVGGGAAGTALTMPVLAPLGDFAGVDRALVVTTWSAAAGWLRLILPTNAILIAGLALAKVGFDQYLRFVAPLMGILLAVIIAVLLFGALV